MDESMRNIVRMHDEAFKKFGVSPQSLFWGKGKQNIRFSQLLSGVRFEKEIRILDIGCGFGDLNHYLRHLQTVFSFSYRYCGCDLSETFIGNAEQKWKGHDNISFCQGDFLELEWKDTFDIGLISGTLNYKICGDNYQHAERMIAKAFDLCGSVSADFLSDKVDWRMEELFYYNPGKVLEIFYKYSRNLILKNDYMPFEFCVLATGDDSFRRETTVFNKFMEENEEAFRDGLYSVL